MTSTRTSSRAIKLVATVAVGFLVIVGVNTVRTDSQNSAALSLATSSLITVPTDQQPTPTPIATTAPVQLPTSTAVPTPTVVPTATAAPTTAPEPLPTATVAPPATPVPEAPDTSESAISVADAGAVAAPTATPPNPVAAEPTATAVAPTATVEPTPTVEAPIEPAAAEPTPEPTATVEPTPEPTSPPLETAADLEFFVLGEINAARANAGLGPLALDPAASAIARDWSQQMANGGFFDHRPGAELSAMLPAGWLQWGENIASAPDIFWAQSSLESSAGHYENMVGPFTAVGVGVFTTGSQVWLTQVFVRY